MVVVVVMVALWAVGVTLGGVLAGVEALGCAVHIDLLEVILSAIVLFYLNNFHWIIYHPKRSQMQANCDGTLVSCLSYNRE